MKEGIFNFELFTGKLTIMCANIKIFIFLYVGLCKNLIQFCADIFLVKRPIIVTMKVDQHNDISFYLRTYLHFIKLGSYKRRRFFRRENRDILMLYHLYNSQYV